MKSSEHKKLIEEKRRIIDGIKNINKAEKWLLIKHVINSQYGFTRSSDEIVDYDIPSLYPDMWFDKSEISYKELYEMRLKMIKDKLKEKIN